MLDRRIATKELICNVNVILFNPDEMRAESVGCYGHPVVRTPHLDRLAADGVRFDQCHAQHTVCTPSRCSFMTGWYPHVSGHRTLWHALRPHEPNLLRYLRQAGYDVRWWGKNDLLTPQSLRDSVDSAGHPGGPLHGRNPFAPDDPRYYSFLYEPPDGPPTEQGDYRCVQAAIDYLRAGPTKPFALYLPLGFPHCPFWAPKPWHDQVRPQDVPPLRPVVTEGKPDYVRLIRRYRRLDELDESAFRQANAIYLGMISFVDHLLGQLLAALDASGLGDDTVVIAFSDHGEWAGDFGLVEKWPSALDDCLTRVPFIVRAPGNRAGHVVREPVELFDLMATVLDLAGVEPRHTHFARSLVPQLRGAAGDPDRAAFAEGGYDPHEPHCFEGYPPRAEAIMKPGHIYYPKLLQQQEHPESVCRAAMVRTVTHKLVRRPLGQSELYDLRADPGELRNLYDRADAAAVQAGLEQRLLDWYVRTADVVPFDEDPRGFVQSR